MGGTFGGLRSVTVRWKVIAALVVALGVLGLAQGEVDPSRVGMTVSVDAGGVLAP